MKLWLIKQDVNNGYDTYDSAVVVAETAEEARGIHPSSSQKTWGELYSVWADSPNQVSAVEIGEAKDNCVRGRVILASFNAG